YGAGSHSLELRGRAAGDAGSRRPDDRVEASRSPERDGSSPATRLEPRARDPGIRPRNGEAEPGPSRPEGEPSAAQGRETELGPRTGDPRGPARVALHVRRAER